MRTRAKREPRLNGALTTLTIYILLFHRSCVTVQTQAADVRDVKRKTHSEFPSTKLFIRAAHPALVLFVLRNLTRFKRKQQICCRDGYSRLSGIAPALSTASMAAAAAGSAEFYHVPVCNNFAVVLIKRFKTSISTKLIDLCWRRIAYVILLIIQL
jgi:hypothetical protein